jgi:hypothetical protein
MSNLYRDPSIDAPYQVSFGLSKRCQRRRFLKINNIGIEITAFWKQISIFKQELSFLEGPLWELLIPFWFVSKHGRHRYTLMKYRWDKLSKSGTNWEKHGTYWSHLYFINVYLWRPCLLTNQNGMSNSHRGPSIDASYHGFGPFGQAVSE